MKSSGNRQVKLGNRQTENPVEVFTCSKHPRVWKCDSCGKQAVLPAKQVWVKCAECGEDLALRPVRILDGVLVVYNETRKRR